MAYRSKKKKYRIKPIPVIIALLVVIALILCAIFAINALMHRDKSVTPDASSLPNSTSQQEVSSTDSTSSKPDVINYSSVQSSDSSKPNSSKPSSSGSQPAAIPFPGIGKLPDVKITDWNLILLNPDENNKIGKELDIKKVKFDTQYVDARAGDAYQKMYNAAKKDGIILYLRSGYRSMKTQERNFNNEVARYEKLGNSHEKAVTLTKKYYTVPGHSEHHTGLAFDIITPEYHNVVYTLDERFAKTDAYKWLTKHCVEYGFVLRYPKDKVDATQINYEPWHYRYVGVENAKYITQNKLCLEEYIKILEDK